MTTVLELVNFACSELAIPQVATLIGVTDQPTLRLKASLISAARELRSTKVFPQQKKTYPFTTVTDQSSYPLPEDFYSQLLKTQFNVSTQRELLQISDAEMVNRLYGIVITTGDICYRIFGSSSNPNYTIGGQFEINPTPSFTDPSDAEDLYFEYITKNLFRPPYWQPSHAYTANQYVSSGQYFYKANNSDSSTTVDNAPIEPDDYDDSGLLWLYQPQAYESPLSDDDLCLFDDDPMILGVIYKYLRSSGQDYSLELEQFNTARDSAAARYTTPSLGSFSRRGFRPRYTVPYGNWSI